MTALKNSNPAHIWDVLQRLLLCNKAQLANRLGIHPRTLKRWIDLTEAGQQPGKDATERASDLLRTVLSLAESEVHALPIEWSRIRTIGGRR